MIDTQSIRNKILNLAIHGLLIEQKSSDGTGLSLIEENYKTINLSDESIKRRFGKGCKPLKQEDFLFDIPEKWCWERFGNLVINYDSQRKPVTKSERKRLIGQYDYYGATGAIDRVDDYIFDGEYLMIGEDGGNFYVSRDNSFIARGKFWANNHVHVVKPVTCDITYLKHCLDAYDLPKMGLVYGIGAPKLNQENMNSIPIPVPPLAEQKRIVEKIEQAFSVLDTIDELQAQYADNLTVLKSKLIDLAIRGKLTEQLPEDGTAEELYQQIQAEKQALIQSGKIKKEKPLPEIAEDEIPFEIPENWKWSYLGELFQHNTGKALNAKDTHGKLLEYITTSNLYWDHFELKELKKMPFTDEEVEKCTVNKGDLLVCEGGDIGRSAIWPFDYEMRIQNHIHRLRKFCNGICTKYYYYLLLLYKQSGRINGIGIGLQGFSSKRVHSLIVPLPPLAEQKRIVDRLDQILAVCDEMR